MTFEKYDKGSYVTDLSRLLLSFCDLNCWSVPVISYVQNCTVFKMGFSNDNRQDKIHLE